MRRVLTRLLLALYLCAGVVCAQELHIKDGSTWREISEVHVNDSGTWREVTEIWVNDSGTWRQVYVAVEPLLSASGTAGTSGSNVGYQFPSQGSLSPVITTDGKSVIGATDISGVAFRLTVSGFGSDPGQTGWAISVTVDGGAALLFSSATSFAYDDGSGQAQWTWTGAAGFTNGVAFTLVIQ